MFFIHLERFGPLSKYPFCLFLSPLSFWDSCLCMLYFIVTHETLRICSFFFSFFFLFYRLDNLNRPTFIFADSFFCLLKFVVELLQWFFFLIPTIILFNSQISIWFFCIISISLLILFIWWEIIFIIHLNSLDMVSFHSLNTLITADVKCLPGKSNIWVPSGTISIGHFFPMSKPYFSVFCASYNILWKSRHFR